MNKEEQVAISNREAKACLLSPAEEIVDSLLLSSMRLVVSCSCMLVNRDSISKLTRVTGASRFKKEISLTNSA